MIRVAVTGGIGVGKTLVCKIFNRMGIPVFHADAVAKTITDEDLHVREKLTAWFGKDIYLPNGALHRKNLADIIFNDNIALQNVNNLIHPKVYEFFNDWCEQQDAPFVIQETAIVFENKHSERFDKIIAVTAPTSIKIERVLKRENSTREQVLERIKNQLPDEEKVKMADFVIYNDEKELILPQIVNIYKQLK